MYQQIQGLNTDEKGLEISKIWRWIVQQRNFNEFQTALSEMNISKIVQNRQNVRFECQTISENIKNLKPI
jgi:hypothetical protein